MHDRNRARSFTISFTPENRNFRESFSANKQERVSGILGFASGPGPDGKYLTGDEPLGDYQNNLTSQAVKVSFPGRDTGGFMGADLTATVRGTQAFYTHSY